jgi:hypothetical protein
MSLLEGDLHSMHPLLRKPVEMFLMCQQVDKVKYNGWVKSSPIRNSWRYSCPTATMTEAWGMFLSLWAIGKEAVMPFRLGVAGLPEKEGCYCSSIDLQNILLRVRSTIFPAFMQWLVMPLKP